VTSNFFVSQDCVLKLAEERLLATANFGWSAVDGAPQVSLSNCFRMAHKRWRAGRFTGWCVDVDVYNQLKGLILAQNERWRRGLGMQVER
jgi:hypothetical protein